MELALARICHVQEYANLKQSSPYFSVDPAFPLKGCSDVELLTTMLMNEKLSLYQRYQAMFTLRDLATPESIEAIGKGIRLKLGTYYDNCKLITLNNTRTDLKVQFTKGVL